MLVTLITTHPEYKCNKARNDIAILELDSDVTWSDLVQPACFSSKFADGDWAVVAGWGRTSENNTDSDKKTSILQKAKVAILNNDVCRSWYHSQGKKTKIDHTQLCAGRKEGGVDACWADSGGPLMWEDDNSNLSIIGVVSTGIGCARPFLPGIYTRVSEFLSWIQSEVDKTNLVA
ncbi:testisin-like isoform X1 [Atheta coriaria]|uniref:testisin-like isoform X1 n=1 Tax=Dalotia coriaria TaxID=877792 RepID=UPI0031F38539